jgi:3'-phosphoadenosine 5'-phosphosulfate sulfotransferase (PAPS reductase)/FAD synthetase
MKLITFKEVADGVKALRCINGRRRKQEQARTQQRRKQRSELSGSGWGGRRVEIGGSHF